MTSGPRRNKKGAVLVFGESVNDSQSITHLLIGANASLADRVRSLRRPVSLTRDAKPNAVRDWVNELRRTVQAFEAVNGHVAAVVVHRDADGHDPNGTVAADLARQLTTLDGHPVVPVQAIESWWFLFPEAVEAVRPRAWKDSLPRQPQDVELIDQPKKALQQATRGRRAPEYGKHLRLLRIALLMVDMPARTTSRTIRIVRDPAIGGTSGYVAVAGNDTAAVELYEWNIAASGAFYEVLGMVEVLLRNAMHTQVGPLATASRSIMCLVR